MKGDNSKMASETVMTKRKENENNIVANKRTQAKRDIKRGNNKAAPEKDKNENSITEGSQTYYTYATNIINIIKKSKPQHRTKPPH